MSLQGIVKSHHRNLGHNQGLCDVSLAFDMTNFLSINIRHYKGEERRNPSNR